MNKIIKNKKKQLNCENIAPNHPKFIIFIMKYTYDRLKKRIINSITII